MGRALLAALALCLLLTASGARALPPGGGPIGPIDDCFDDPEGCVLDPTDPCLENPELCEPPPPPDPCVVDPASCEPDPVDPCEVTDCEEEPPVAEPPGPTFSHELSGPAKVKAAGQKSTAPYTLSLSFDTSALTFSAMDGDGTLYTGRLAPKGKKGTKFQLFLDATSDTAFSADIAGRGAQVSGRSAGSVLGQSGKLILKLLPEGGTSLKIKREVLVANVGEVVFKANLSAEAQP
jgi:hypothetical protein